MNCYTLVLNNINSVGQEFESIVKFYADDLDRLRSLFVVHFIMNDESNYISEDLSNEPERFWECEGQDYEAISLIDQDGNDITEVFNRWLGRSEIGLH